MSMYLVCFASSSKGCGNHTSRDSWDAYIKKCSGALKLLCVYHHVQIARRIGTIYDKIIIQPGGGVVQIKSGHTSGAGYPSLSLTSIGSGATDGGKLVFRTMPRHDNTTPNDGDDMGKIWWQYNNDADPDGIIGDVYVEMLVEAKDVSSSNEKGTFTLSVITDNDLLGSSIS